MADLERLIGEFRVDLDRAARFDREAAMLRASYGAPAPGRVVIEHHGTVESDEKRLIAEIHAATQRNARELNLMIGGRGGLSTSMWRIIDALNGFKGLRRGIIVGPCPSATAVIFAVCDERIGPPSAEIMVHACGFYKGDRRYPYTPPRYTAASLDREAAKLAQTDNRLAALLEQRTGSAEFCEMIASGADHYLSAADAFRLGLLTRVEPADTQPISRLSLSMYFSTRKAKALSQLATMARARGSAGPSVVNVTLKGEFGPNRSIKASGVRKQLSEGRFASSMLVFIDSIGGDYIEAMRIYAMLREHPARRKKAIISGDCQSAAIVPLLACDIRVAQQRATLLLHRASINPWENRGRRWTAEQLQEAAAQAEGVDDATADLLAERTGHDRNWFRKEMESERPLRLVDALRVGILHQICGVTSPPNPAWAQRVASMAHAGTVIGLSSHMFSSSYLAACKAMMG